MSVSLRAFDARGQLSGNFDLSKQEAMGLVNGITNEMSNASAEYAAKVQTCVEPFKREIMNVVLYGDPRGPLTPQPPPQPPPQPHIEYEGPVELKGIDLVYFLRSADQGRVLNAFRGAKIAYRTRKSDEGIPSDIITCTPDVPVNAVKKLAQILIDAGVPIRSISNFVTSG